MAHNNIHQKLILININALGNHIDTNTLLDYYYQILYRIIDEYIPYREFIQRKKDKPWMNGFLRHMISLRNRMNGVYNKTLREDHKRVRIDIRAATKKELVYASKRYYAGLKDELGNKGTNIIV